MNVHVFLPATTLVIYLGLGSWVLLQQKNRAHLLYGLLCIATCFWQGAWITLFLPLAPEVQSFWLKVCYTVILGIPVIFSRLIAELTEQQTVDKGFLLSSGLASILLLLNWMGSPLFTQGYYVYSWGKAAQAGPLYALFLGSVGFAAYRIVRLLRNFIADPGVSESKRKSMKWVLAATLIYALGAEDFLANYGLAVYPLSCVFAGISLVLFCYSLLRHDALLMSSPGESAEEQGQRLAASEEMKHLGMTAAFPLVSDKELVGYLVLGEKMSEEAYSQEDLLLLRIVANQAALAYQRVRYLEMAVRGARTEMVSEIAGGFAHEIKTPLANISLPAEMSLMDLQDIEKGRRTVEDVLPELKARLKDIMQQTFKVSEKIEAIRQFSKSGLVQLEPVDLGKVLQSSLGLLDHVLQKAHIQIVTEIPDSLPIVRGDAKQLEIVFVNLIKNAAEAMSQNAASSQLRTLRLKGWEEREWVMASVKDSGPGIKHTDFSHLFEAYFTTKGSSGTGMGLFLSQQVVKAHGGSIQVNSEEGQGTEFIIRLPKQSPARAGIHQAA